MGGRLCKRCASIGILKVCDECHSRGEDKSSRTHIGTDKAVIPAGHVRHQRTLRHQLKHVLASQFHRRNVMREHLQRSCQRVGCTGKYLRIRGTRAAT
jgi:hypothetical protein